MSLAHDTHCPLQDQTRPDQTRPDQTRLARPLFEILGIYVDRPRSLFYFVPQEKGLIRWVPWGWKNLGYSIFHWEDGSPSHGPMHLNWSSHMPRSQWSLSELCFFDTLLFIFLCDRFHQDLGIIAIVNLSQRNIKSSESEKYL